MIRNSSAKGKKAADQRKKLKKQRKKLEKLDFREQRAKRTCLHGHLATAARTRCLGGASGFVQDFIPIKVISLGAEYIPIWRQGISLYSDMMGNCL
jgi:hypothetical protein